MLTLAVVRQGDTLVVPKLDRLARFVPDARVIADQLRERGVKLALGRALYDPGDPIRSCYSISPPLSPSSKPTSAAGAPARACHRPRQGEIARQAAQTLRQTAVGTLPHARHRRVFHQRSRRALLRLKTNRLSHTQPASFPLAYDLAPYRNRPEMHHIGPHGIRGSRSVAKWTLWAENRWHMAVESCQTCRIGDT